MPVGLSNSGTSAGDLSLTSLEFSGPLAGLLLAHFTLVTASGASQMGNGTKMETKWALLGAGMWSVATSPLFSVSIYSSQSTNAFVIL